MPKVSDLDIITLDNAADYVPVLDTSDTTDSAEGTLKRTLGSAIGGAGSHNHDSDYLQVANNLSDLATPATARANLGVAIGSDVQAHDADLDAIAALSTAGLIARTGAGTAAARSITAATGLSVSNGDGVAGNPQLALDVNALTAEATVDGAADYFLMYDADVGAHRKVLGNNLPGGGGGASALNDLSDVTITTPADGHALTYNGSAWVNQDRYVQLAGDTMTGALTVSGVGRGLIVANSSNANIVVNPGTGKNAALIFQENGTDKVFIAYNSNFSSGDRIPDSFEVLNSSSTPLIRIHEDAAPFLLVDASSEATLNGTLSVLAAGESRPLLIQNDSNTNIVVNSGTNDNGTVLFQENGTDKIFFGYNSNTSSSSRVPNSFEVSNAGGGGLLTIDEGAVGAMRINASADTGVGLVTGISAQLHVDQPSTTGAQPVLLLDQADVSEEFIRLIGESGPDASQSLVDAADVPSPGSVVGWFKIYVQDDQGTGPIASGTYFVPFYDAPT